jgi:hypothetical protein
LPQTLHHLHALHHLTQLACESQQQAQTRRWAREKERRRARA